MMAKMKRVRFIMAGKNKNKTRIGDACHGHLLVLEEENAFNVYKDKRGVEAANKNHHEQSLIFRSKQKNQTIQIE